MTNLIFACVVTIHITFLIKVCLASFKLVIARLFHAYRDEFGMASLQEACQVQLVSISEA